ncbi:glycosyltransferase family 2 protein [Sphingobacterium spiritivorum]|uniref:glycosyltransferase family 2 protein n=1 Tax=Sphingobacterium spiritivorum TaxID=258 RepID=UPI003DA3426C
MKILAIIVTYNFEKWIDKCLPSLIRSDEPVDILVIDNLSQDQTINRIRQEYPSVRLIANDQNLGFGKANNIGLTIAIEEHYDYVFLINQDAWITPPSIGNMIQHIEQDLPEGIISPVHLTGEGNELDHGFATYIGNRDLEKVKQDETTRIVEFINAAFWFIPVSILRKVGGFSPLFYHYGEDKDYANRLKFHHCKFGYTSSAIGFHDRAFRKPSFAATERAEYVYFLSEYANINYTFGKAFGKSILAAKLKSIKAFFKGDLKLCWAYYKMIFKLLAKTSEVTQVRKQTKNPGRNFI